MIIDKIYNRLAMNSLISGNYSKAEKYFKKAMSINSNKEGINYNCAVAMLGTKKFDEAEICLHREMEISGQNYNTLKTISELYYISGQRKKATDYLKKALEKCSDENESALLKNKIKNTADEKAYNKSLKALELFEKGTALLNQGEWEKAKDQFLKALDLDKTNPFVYNNLGFISMMKEKKYFEAREFFKKALKLSNLPIIKQNLDKVNKIISQS
ncbi:MAG: tetratricopeptide repeat protein [Spirochaetota bacterium]